LKQYTADKIRNIALAGHGSDGKTSLTEAMLYLAGATDRLGSIADGNTVCDFDPEEIKRQISVSSAVAPLEYKGAKVNVIDTPGLFDFASGLYEGVRAADTVLITLSAKSGTLVGTEKAWKLASVSKKARAFFISKIDQENADYFKAFESLKENFGDIVCPIVVPVGGVYVNLIEKKAYKFEKGKAVEAAMPSDARLEELSMSIAETIANTSDDLMEKFFAGDIAGARALHLKLFPLFKGLFITSNPVPLKAALNLKGFPAGGLRLPLVNASEDEQQIIKKMLTEIGLLK